MPNKSLLKRGFKTEAEKISEKYREELGVSKFSPLDAFSLAEHIGIPIFKVDDVFENSESNSHAKILNAVSSKFSALWMPNVDSDKIIIHNVLHSGKRQQSNIMHELAHIIRKHEIPYEYARLCQSLQLHYFNKEHEEEAKYLGGCLQITRSGLQWALKNNYSKEEISEYYNASIEMVNYRLNISGVLLQRSYFASERKPIK